MASSSFTRSGQRFLKGFVVGWIFIEILSIMLFLWLFGLGFSKPSILFISALSGVLGLIVGLQKAVGSSPYASEEDGGISLYSRWRAWNRVYSPWEMFWKTWLLSTIATFFLNVFGRPFIPNGHLLDLSLGEVVLFSICFGVLAGIWRTFTHWGELTGRN